MLLFQLILAATAFLGVSAAEKLNVHIVGHTHDDPGWLKTADQYYTGSNSSIYLAGVQFIFDSVVTELSKSKDRKYTFCEISFFQRWWHEQDAEMKSRVKELVSSGQLGFVNGGWVMHDEASTHYMSMIDQTTLGHNFLLNELNYRPKVGWQIDPFGHSNTHAWLSAEVGFDALFFGRIDYQDRQKRLATRDMEMLWKGSYSQPDIEVFTGAFHDGNYGPPAGFCFDTSCGYCRNDPVVDDPLLSTYNVDDKVNSLISSIITEQAHSKGNNIMLKLGSDFSWDNAHTWFKSLDKLIERVNQDGRFNVFYSDPTTYMRAKAAESTTWSVKTDDFFPYSDCEHCFWAGYFTSRPTLKFLERFSSGYLQVLKQIAAAPLRRGSSSVMTFLKKAAHDAIFHLTAGVGLINHHDAVTGTSKQHVADDYNKILSAALTEAEKFASQWLTVLHADAVGETLTVCRLANETTCDATQALQSGASLNVYVYNPLPRTRSSQVTVYLSDAAAVSKTRVSVFAMNAGEQPVRLAADLIPAAGTSPNTNAASWLLVFTASNVPALTYSKYLIRMENGSDEDDEGPVTKMSKEERVSESGDAPTLTVSNDAVELTFNRATGLLQKVTRKDSAGNGVSADVTNDLQYYKSFGSPGLEDFVHPPIDRRDPHLQNIEPAAHHVGSTSSQASGAYIFRSSRINEVPTSIAARGQPVQLTVVRGRGVIEVRQTFSSWASQIVRIREGTPVVEFEFTVGAIPISDNIGKEVISHFTSSIKSGPQGSNKFYTDSNGREFMPRQFNYRETWDLKVFEPIAGNYYPVAAAMYVKDEDTADGEGAQLSVLTDRGQSGASLAPGEIELMVHRRLLADDARGVNEPLNETTGGITPYPEWKRKGDGITVSGTHYLILSPKSSAMKELRTAMDEVYLKDTMFVSPPTKSSGVEMTSQPTAAMLGADLPVNVQLVSLERLSVSKLLVRVGHQFAVGEDATLSQPVTIDLAAVLAPYGPLAATELTLSANQKKSERDEEKIHWSEEPSRRMVKKTASFAIPVGEDSLLVTLQPMQIKTFEVDVQH